MTLKSSSALPTAAIAVAGFHSLLFLALGGRDCAAAQPCNEMHQMETIWKKHPTLTLRATWKRTIHRQKPPSCRQTALSETLPATRRALGSPSGPKSSALSLLCLVSTTWVVHLLRAEPLCSHVVGKRSSGDRKATTGAQGKRGGTRVGRHGRNKSIIRHFSSGNSEEDPVPSGKLQGTALSSQFPLA